MLLIVQPLECADGAGFTLVQSHCCTLHSAPSGSHASPAIFTRYNLQVFQEPDARVWPHLKLMNKSACGALTHISQKLSQVEGERKSSQMKKERAGEERETFENEKSPCVSRARSQTVQVPRREATEAGARGTEDSSEWKHTEKLGSCGKIYSFKRKEHPAKPSFDSR